MALLIFTVANSLTAVSISLGTWYKTTSCLGFPTSFTILSIKSIRGLISSWPNNMASKIVSSGTSFAPASTIMMASLVPATTRLRSLTSLLSNVGLMTNSPSTNPTETAPIGPSKGMSEIDRAIEEPIIATTSGVQSGSTHKTVAMTCTSLK